MFEIEKSDLPANALLQRYTAIEGCYTDCFSTEAGGAINLSDFVAAFYTTPLFKFERFLLRYTVSKPSTDREARELANAQIDSFAAWSVEALENGQLLMCDSWGKTRSWFMVAPQLDEEKNTTRLYFGSAVVPVPSTKRTKPSISSSHQAMLGFHKLYSRALLSAARSRLNHSSEVTTSTRPA